MNVEGPIERLRRHSDPGLALHHLTSVVGLRGLDADGNVVGAGSAVVVRDRLCANEFRIVTARHVAKGLLAAAAMIHVEVRYASTNNLAMAVRPVPIDLTTWVFHESDDLALAKFPADLLEDDHYLSSALVERFAYLSFGPTPDVTLIGRWGEHGEDGFVLTRRGILSTMERPEVRVFVGHDLERQRKRMYIVDATVTRGMSGGAVFGSSQPPLILGLISGHDYVEVPSSKFNELPPSVGQAAAAIWEALAPMNAGLVFVVPMDRVVEFLKSDTAANPAAENWPVA